MHAAPLSMVWLWETIDYKYTCIYYLWGDRIRLVEPEISREYTAIEVLLQLPVRVGDEFTA